MQVPVIVSLPESLARGANLLGGKCIYLKVGITQSMAEVSEPKAVPSGICPLTQMASSIKPTLPKAEEEVSMTTEVRELLTWTVLDISGHGSTNSTPKRPNPVVMLIPLPHKLGDIFSPVDMSSQVGALDDAEMGEASLEEIPTVPLPLAKTPGPSGDTLPVHAGLLHKEANRALGDLLATKSSIEACWQKLVWGLSMALCQNESETTESMKEANAICITAVREAKATCAHSIQEAKTLCSMAIKEAKATCAHSIQEAETLCSMAIRDTEAWGATQDGTLQKSHAKSILQLEEQAIEEETKSQLDFLSACQTTLQASPAELCSTLVASYQVSMGQALTSLPCNPSQGVSSSEQVPTPVAFSPPAPEPMPRPKWQHPSPDPVDASPSGRATPQANVTGSPSSKWQEVMPLYKVLTASCLEAFNQDSPLAKETREEYFRKHSPNFNAKNTCDLSEVFQHMNMAADLLGSSMKLKKHGWDQMSYIKQTTC